MARRYVRDAKGRFASKGYSGQTGGRGARLKSAGKTRAGGGKRENLIGANDQTMTSLPKGTIGKTQRLRNRSKIDMSGQQFAGFEKGKKAAKADISRQKQEAWLKQTQKKLDKAPLAKEMSKAEFARKTGGKTRDDSMSAAIEMSRQPRGRTKAGDRRNEARLKKIQDDVRATDKAYDAAIKSGKIKAPTDSLARKAAGEASNPAVQAAKRLQAKTAAKRAQLSSQQKRSIETQQIEASRSASRNSARIGNAGNTPAQSAAYAKAAKPAGRTKKSQAQRDIEAAQRRLKTKQYGYTANQGQALAIDRRLAKMTPQQLASSRVRSARFDSQRTQRNLRQGRADGASSGWIARMEKSLQARRADFKKAAADYRTLNPRRKRK